MSLDVVTQNEIDLENRYIMDTFNRYGVEFVSGSGAKLYDVEGNEYLDFLAGIAVCCLGHSNEAVVSAICKQAKKLMHVSNYFYIENRAEVAQKISNLLNFGSDQKTDWKMFFTNSGAESNECALKIARFLANRKNNNDAQHTKVVVLKDSFHGRTFETLAATAQERFHDGLAPMSPVFIEVKRNNEEELKNVFSNEGNNISAVLIEPVQGESGVHPLTENYMKLIRDLTNECGALMICDEVQTGVFRTGKPFAFQFSRIIPDVVTIAKGIGGGFPCGVCAACGVAAQTLTPSDHGTTFGGSCLAVSAIKETLEELNKMDVILNVNEVSKYMFEKLETITEIAEVRGKGLMVGAELKEGIDAHEVVEEALFNEKLVINATSKSTLRFLPPLIITKEDVDIFANKLQTAIKNVATLSKL